MSDPPRPIVVLTHNPEDLDAYYGRALEPLRTIAEVVVNPLDRDLETPELIALAAGADVIVSHRSTGGPAELFDACGSLKLFLRCAVDIRNVDVQRASALGIGVGTADKSFIASTAELALGLMLDAARNIAASVVDYRSGAEPPQRTGRQLAGHTAGIIGYGDIGRYLADLLLAIGMRVLVHDPYVDVAPTDGLTQVPLEALLGAADYVLPLAPASEETTDLIGVAELAAMKENATLVNVSRGELVDENAVAAALDARQLGALAMDVGRAADQRPSLPLAGRHGVVATPHLGGLTAENADAQAASSVEQVAAMIDGRTPPRLVNPDAATRMVDWWSC